MALNVEHALPCLSCLAELKSWGDGDIAGL